jgi:thiol-disulfide isomerase/thioredoxin
MDIKAVKIAFIYQDDEPIIEGMPHYICYMKFYLAAILLLIIVKTGSAQSNRIYTRQYRDSVLDSYIGTKYVDYHLQLPNDKICTNQTDAGKVVLLNFWFGGCPACLEEFSAFNELYDSLKNNPSFRFISLAREPAERIPALIKKYNIHYPVVPVTSDECSRLNYKSGFPTTIIIDKNGRIALFKMEGYSEKMAQQVIIGKWLPKIRAMLQK